MAGAAHSASISAQLPNWDSVLAVVAHPDDESFALGAVLDAFRRSATRTAVLCLTSGEASSLSDIRGELASVRRQEFAAAAHALGIEWAALRDYPDGALCTVCRTRLAGEVIDAAHAVHADGLLVFEPSGVTGHPDQASATAAAMLAAAGLELPVLAWTIPESVSARLNQEFGAAFVGAPSAAIDIELPVERTRQLTACAAHVSQAVPGSVLWRRLELLGAVEYLTWLPVPGATPAR